MTKCIHISTLVIAMLGFAGCTTEADAPSDSARVVLWPAPASADGLVDTEGGGAPRLRPGIEAVELVMDLAREASDVCACSGAGCVYEWIEGTFGCDICVSVECPATDIGGCVRCPLHPLLSEGSSRPLVAD